MWPTNFVASPPLYKPLVCSNSLHKPLPLPVLQIFFFEQSLPVLIVLSLAYGRLSVRHTGASALFTGRQLNQHFFPPPPPFPSPPPPSARHLIYPAFPMGLVTPSRTPGGKGRRRRRRSKGLSFQIADVVEMPIFILHLTGNHFKFHDNVRTVVRTLSYLHTYILTLTYSVRTIWAVSLRIRE